MSNPLSPTFADRLKTIETVRQTGKGHRRVGSAGATPTKRTQEEWLKIIDETAKRKKAERQKKKELNKPIEIQPEDLEGGEGPSKKSDTFVSPPDLDGIEMGSPSDPLIKKGSKISQIFKCCLFGFK
jgi:hypothetical protein